MAFCLIMIAGEVEGGGVMFRNVQIEMLCW